MHGPNGEAVHDVDDRGMMKHHNDTGLLVWLTVLYRNFSTLITDGTVQYVIKKRWTE